MTHSNPRRLFAGVPVMMRKISEPRYDGIQHRDVDVLALTRLLSLIERQKDAYRRVHARSDIGDRNTRSCGLVRITGGRNNPAFPLYQQIVGFDIAVRSVLAITRKRTINQTRIDCAEFLIAEPKPSCDARRIVLKEDVRSLCQGLKNFSSFLLLNVDRETPLISIEPNITRRQPLNDRIPRSNDVADAGPLNLDHLRAHVGQQASCKRARKHLLERKNLDAIEGAALFLICWHITSYGLNGWNGLNAALRSSRSSRSNRSNRLHLDSSLIVGNKSVFGAWAFFHTITLRA